MMFLFVQFQTIALVGCLQEQFVVPPTSKQDNENIAPCCERLAVWFHQASHWL
jgi:hypothetical protein